MKTAAKRIYRRVLPKPVRRHIDSWVRQRDPFKSLRRLDPLRPDFGHLSGQCVDRYYIENFLERNSEDVRARVLEVQEDTYAVRFGDGNVHKTDILHVSDENPKATVVADLTQADHIPANTYDCIILTQTLHFIYDIRAAVKTLERILKPGGVLLATIPGISQVSRYDMDQWGDFWRMTSLSVTRLFGEFFPEDLLLVEPFGNVLTSVAFLHGIVANELTKKELDFHDPNYEMIITVRAVKPGPERLNPERRIASQS